ncbi:MAG TPA: NAD-dependent malic enzyme [Acidimicrobiia bacterium]|nr:NAD-dependent malic enzyme [Acidimicrobiia bacterium]
MQLRSVLDPASGERYLPVEERGRQLLSDSLLNKGTAFTLEEREAFGLRGLLPPQPSTLEEQLARVRSQWDAKPTPVEKHIFLAGLLNHNETLFHRFVVENLQETVPVVYTPTVAEACRHWSRMNRHARGIYVTPADRGQIARVLRNRGMDEAAVVVVTDNERILGIGDQGCGGMGIPIGKLALYTAGAGIHPALCVPVSLDVGTNNEELLKDPLYLGRREPRLRGDPYWSLVDEFVNAVKEVWPGALLQWEDFANVTSFRLMDTYRDQVLSFNDDIEGTAAMVVGGLMAAMRSIGSGLGGQVYTIYGGGSAGTGMYRQLVTEMKREGLTSEQAARHIYVIDQQGLLVDDDPSLDQRMRTLATPREVVAQWHVPGDRISLEQVVEHARPTVLIGVCARPNQFSEAAIRAMASYNERPIVMPMSNPTANAEAVPADVIAWSSGRALVATGSPFEDVVHEGRRHRVGQANNAFIFPGVGLGAIAVKARKVTSGMFSASARALADMVDEQTLAEGSLYPPMSAVREVSRRVAVAVAEQAVADGVADPVADIEAAIAAAMWYPEYLPYRPA